MPSTSLKLLRSVPLFAPLDDSAITRLADRLRRRVFRRGMMVFHKDQQGDALYIVDSGHIRIFVPAETGEELTLDLHGTGAVFGELALLDGQPRSASAQAIVDTVAYELRREDFRRYLMSAPEAALAIVGLLSARLRHVMRYAECLGFLDLHARVAWILLQLAEQQGSNAARGAEIAVPLSQAELASMVGAARGRVNRALAVFRAQGLIAQRGKKIVLLEPDRLRQRIY